MASSEKTFCNTHHRHLRFLFLVDDRVNRQFLIDLFIDNYQLWGGRYNPVIPVHNGELSAFYQNIISYLDPDIVYYSEQVGPEVANELCKNLQPKELVQLDPDGRNNFQGVYAHNLLPEAYRQYRYFLRPFSLVYFNRHQEDPQTSFYNLSFGIINQYVEDITLTDGYRTTTIDITNITETNRHITQQRPFFNALLSEQQAEFTLLTPNNDWEINHLEFIIYDESQPFDDLIYFWNRALSQRPNSEILQIISSRTQLALLMTDPSFGGVLNLVARNNEIFLRSFSISNEELESSRLALQTLYPETSFRVANYNVPRISGGEFFRFQRTIIKSKNVLLGKKDHLQLPAPTWNSNKAIRRGSYIYDAEFFVEDGVYTNYLKLPYGTVLGFLLGRHEARVNKSHSVSFFLDPDQQGLDITVPTSDDIFQCRLRARIQRGELINIPLKFLSPSDAGLKLSSFVNLFDGRLSSSNELLSERFWIDIILGQSTADKKRKFEFKRIKNTDESAIEEPFSEEVKESNIHNNDGSFSYLDLKAERRLVYLENANGIRQWLATHEQHFNDDELIAFITRSTEEDFKHHIDPDMQYLVDRNALFIGMKVKCPHCGSNTWYALADLKNKMSCKGCLQTIIPAIESHLYYRFNDVIHNNISSNPIMRAKTYHGNYIVLRTLAHYERHHSAHNSFYWAPSMDIGIQAGRKFVKTDIDIAMIRHGKLAIGEAKASASDFNASQFEQLRLLAETIRPDQLILAWHSGVINTDRLELLATVVASFGCEVITHQVEAPDYYFGRIR